MLVASAAAPPTPAGRGLLARIDAVALSIGARTGIGALVLACMLVIVLGAASMLETLEKMSDGLAVNLGQLKTANAGLDTLNETMDSLPPTNEHMTKIIATVKDTSTEVKTSKRSIEALDARTKRLNTGLGDIADSTGAMRSSLEQVDAGTGRLAGTVSELNGTVAPLAATQKQMLAEVRQMQTGTGNMNASLAYVVRTLNYITAPPTGQGFMLRVDMDKKTLPPIPGVKAETDPVTAFPRGAWPVYRGR